MLKAVEWKQQILTVVDQTKLPGKITKLQIRTPLHIVDAIKTRKVGGASALGVLAAFGVYLGIKQPPLAKTYDKLIQQIDKICALLIKSQPTSMNMVWALERMKRCARNNRDHKLDTLRDILLREATAILKEDGQVTQTIAGLGVDLIRDGDTILTCGNTGALSSAGRGTALGIIIEAANSRQDLQVVVCETRPGLHGSRQVALELKQAKVPFQLIADNMAAHMMKKGMIDVALAGADRISMNGDVAAEIGTYGLAMLAYHHSLSFYIAAPVSTFDRNLFSGDLIPIEERKPDDVISCHGKPISVPGVKAYYPAFDVTPHKYVSALITELGIIRAPFDQNLKNLFSTLV